MDLGECPKIHEYALRADYERERKNKDYFYDVDVSANFSLNDIHNSKDCLFLGL